MRRSRSAPRSSGCRKAFATKRQPSARQMQVCRSSKTAVCEPPIGSFLPNPKNSNPNAHHAPCIVVTLVFNTHKVIVFVHGAGNHPKNYFHETLTGLTELLARKPLASGIPTCWTTIIRHGAKRIWTAKKLRISKPRFRCWSIVILRHCPTTNGIMPHSFCPRSFWQNLSPPIWRKWLTICFRPRRLMRFKRGCGTG